MLDAARNHGYLASEVSSMRPMEYSDTDIAIVALREYANVGPRTLQQLITRFDTVENIFASAPGEIADLPRMTPEKEDLIRLSIDNSDLIRHRLADYADNEIYLTTVVGSTYPPALLEINDPPPLLYFRGSLEVCRDNCVAIVGSHEASAEAIAEGVRLGSLIAETGTVVVSGLARGIDAAAHLGALKSEGKTIAVLGCGIEDIYPPEHQSLADNIVTNGLICSEYPPESAVDVGRLLSRNRIIVGLARSVIVVEITSGTGGTASAIRETLKQGKSLFTCFNPNLDGAATNELGAVHLKDPDDWKMVIRYMV